MSQTVKPSLLYTIRRISKMFFIAIIGAYGLNIILHTLAILLIGERWIVIEFMNTFAHILWIPTFILIPVCLIMREWRLAAMMLPGLITFLFIWGGMFIPNVEIIPDESDISIRILSYNLNAGNRHIDAYMPAISEIDADIVLFQELHFQHVNVLSDSFTETYPYMAFYPGRGAEGQGIMSRYPIVEDEYWQYDFLRVALGHQRAEISLDDETNIIIYNVHPTNPGMQGQVFNTEFRSREIADLIERASAENLPVILVGDFNMPDFSDDYSAVSNHFSDSFRETGYGLGWTFPNFPVQGQNISFLRLDYIFHSDDFFALDATIYPHFTGSDHKALYADLFVRLPISP